MTLTQKIIMPVQRLDLALRDLKSQGLRPAFLPEIAAERVRSYKAGILEPWHQYLDSGSLRAFRTLKSGYPLVAISHKPNYITKNPGILTEAIERGTLVDRALEIPDSEFERLVSKAGTTTIDYSKKRRHPLNGIVEISQALDDKEAIASFGDYKRAKAYFDAFREIYGRNNVGIWLRITEHNKPLGRLLCLGSNNSLDGSNYLDISARFVGVRSAREK